jgi:hypothetical protein
MQRAQCSDDTGERIVVERRDQQPDGCGIDRYQHPGQQRNGKGTEGYPHGHRFAW